MVVMIMVLVVPYRTCSNLVATALGNNQYRLTCTVPSGAGRGHALWIDFDGGSVRCADVSADRLSYPPPVLLGTSLRIVGDNQVGNVISRKTTGV